MRANGRNHGRPMFWRMGTILLGLVTLSTLVLPAAARPTDGLIAFESNRGGQSDIWVMQADGSNPVNLTNDKPDDVFPAWSPDGRRIAWTRGGRGPEGEIWVMNADGSGKRQVTINGFSDYNASWSPDGLQLVFRSFRGVNRDIYSIHVDGTGEQRLTDDPASDFAPDWSPDGTLIAFTSIRGGHSAIYTMRTDGSDLRKLTADAQEAALPGWSVEGDKILYGDGFCDTCGESDVFVMNADGSGVTQITDSAENELGKSWSRTGKRVVVDWSTLTPSGKHLSKGDIAVIDVESGATINLTKTPGISEEHPDWSPAKGPSLAELGGEGSPAASLDAMELARAPRLHVTAARGRGLATIAYVLPSAGHIRLQLFDVMGRDLGCLVNEWRSAGTHEARLASGPRSQLYFYRLEWAGRTVGGKLAPLP